MKDNPPNSPTSYLEAFALFCSPLFMRGLKGPKKTLPRMSPHLQRKINNLQPQAYRNRQKTPHTKKNHKTP